MMNAQTPGAIPRATPSFRLGRCSLLILLVLTVSAPREAHAQEPFEDLEPQVVEALIRLIEGARAAEESSQWAVAADYYRQAIDVLAYEDFRFGLANCLEQLGELQEAMVIFDELSRVARPAVAEIAASRAAALQESLANLPAQLRLLTNQIGADVSIDDVHSGVIENTDGLALEVDAGDHLLVVQLDGYNAFRDEITLTPGESVRLEVQLTPIAGPDGGEDDGRSLLLPIVLASGAAACVTGGVVFGLMAESTSDEERAYDRLDPDNSRAEATALAEDVDTYATIANIGFVSAGVLLTGAVISYFLGGDGETGDDDGAQVSFSPLVTPQGVGATFVLPY